MIKIFECKECDKRMHGEIQLHLPLTNYANIHVQ